MQSTTVVKSYTMCEYPCIRERERALLQNRTGKYGIRWDASVSQGGDELTYGIE